MTTRELREICQKGGGEPFLLSKFLYRPFTIFVTRLYIAAGASSNTATFHSLLAGLAAAGCGLINSPTALLLTAGFIQVYFVLDHVDGELARYNIHRGRQKLSLAGEFFDLWTHLHTYNLAFATVGFTLSLQTQNLLWFILGLLGANISGSHQRLALSSVLMGALARDRLRLDNPAYRKLLGLTHGATGSADTPPSPARHILRFCSEIALFPGNILGLTLACLGDFCLASLDLPWTACRSVYLMAYGIAGLSSKIFRTRATIRQLQKAAE